MGLGTLGLLLLCTYGGTLGHEELNCAKGWSFYNGACYMIVPGENSSTRHGFNWMSGELYCGQIAGQNGPNQEGHLASIHSQEQQKFIDGLVRAKFMDGRLGRSRDFRIGMLMEIDGRVNTLKGIAWSDGSPVDYGDLRTLIYKVYKDPVHDLPQWYRDNSWLNDLFSRVKGDYLHERHNCVVVRYGPEIPDPEHAYLPAQRRRQEDEFSLIGYRPEEELTHLERGGRWYRGHCHSTVYASIEEMAPVINANEYFGLVCQSRTRDVNCAGSSATHQPETNEEIRQEERSNGAVRQEQRVSEKNHPEQHVNETIRPEQRNNEMIRPEERTGEVVHQHRFNKALRQEERVSPAIGLEQNTEKKLEQVRVQELHTGGALRQEKHIDHTTAPEEGIEQVAAPERRADEQRTEQSADYRPTEGRSTTEEIGIDQQQSVTQEKRIYGAIAQQ